MTTKKAVTPKAKRPPKKKGPAKKSVEQKIAAGEVDADHFVKWGDLKDHLK